MAGKNPDGRAAWRLARRQHGSIARRQLLALGFTQSAIEHRLRTGRLHPTPFRGGYAVGRPELSEVGRLMAAVLSCGDGAVLSHSSAAGLWEIRRLRRGPMHVTVPGKGESRNGITVHQRVLADEEITKRNGIAVTTPLTTLVDLATTLTDRQLQAAINEADKL